MWQCWQCLTELGFLLGQYTCCSDKCTTPGLGILSKINQNKTLSVNPGHERHSMFTILLAAAADSVRRCSHYEPTIFQGEARHLF